VLCVARDYVELGVLPGSLFLYFLVFVRHLPLITQHNSVL